MHVIVILCFAGTIACIALAAWLGVLLLKARESLSEALAGKKLQEELNLAKASEL
jgi:hypothetical protein